MPNTQNNQNNTNTENTTAMDALMVTMMTNMMQNMMQNQQQTMQMMQNMMQNQQQPQQPQPTTAFGSMVADFNSAMNGTKSMLEQMKADQNTIDAKIAKECKTLDLCESIASGNNTAAKELMKAFGIDPKADFAALKEKKAEEITAECNKAAAEEYTAGLKAYVGTIKEFAETMNNVCNSVPTTTAPTVAAPTPATTKEGPRPGSGELDQNGNKMNRAELRNEIKAIKYAGKSERAVIHAENIGHPFVDFGKSMESFFRQLGDAANTRSEYWGGNNK